jgi:hypothetical protein
MSGVSYLLPHPSIAPQLFLSVHRAIARAMDILREPSLRFDLGLANEDTITTHLEFVLENQLRHSGEVKGFNRLNFRKVTRESKVTNFNYEKLDKMPDLIFYLQQERLDTISTQDALFAECKPVSIERAAGGHYCDLGMSRFIKGDYAWAMQEALMVAYAKDGRTIAAHLQPALLERKTALGIKDSLKIVSTKSKPEKSEFLHLSEHERGFQWHTGERCCDLRIYHSWHQC